MKISPWTILAIYLVAGFLTWGWLYNHSAGRDMCYLDKDGNQTTNCYTEDAGRFLNSAIGGVAWPIYWGGVAAIQVTK